MVFVYLARRDKTAIKTLCVCSGGPCSPTRLADLKILGLPEEIASKIQNEIDDNRLMWEPWIESADNYVTLRTTLLGRRYKNVPIGNKGIRLSNIVVDTSNMYRPPMLARKSSANKVL